VSTLDIISFNLQGKIGKPWHFVRIATPNDPQLCGVKGLALDSYLFSGQIASGLFKYIDAVRPINISYILVLTVRLCCP
jgi:hypothetical protein